MISRISNYPFPIKARFRMYEREVLKINPSCFYFNKCKIQMFEGTRDSSVVRDFLYFAARKSRGLILGVAKARYSFNVGLKGG